MCEEFQDLQVEAADRLYEKAVDLANEYELESEQAVALIFDIKVQNGSIYPYLKKQIMRDFANLPDDVDEEASLRIVANRRAEASNPRWIGDVRTRTLTIARGSGTVHGMQYDLKEDYAYSFGYSRCLIIRNLKYLTDGIHVHQIQTKKGEPHDQIKIWTKYLE